MFATQHPRRPRPPGARRPSAQLRAAAAAAGSELSAKTLLNSTTPPPKPLKRASSAKKKGKAKAFVPLVPGGADGDTEAGDTSVEHIEHALSSITPATSMSATSSGTRTRPLSLSSDIFSAASPPPPYGFISLPPMRDMSDDKSEMVCPPPPPAHIESGPSSVRTSWISTDSPFKSNGDGDATAGDTLTLEGFRRFIKDRDEELAAEVSERLAPYEEAMRNMHDTRGSNSSPTGSTAPSSSPSLVRLPPFQQRTPNDFFNFTFPKAPRWGNPPSTQRELERRLAYLQAEAEEERIAQLEAALADARESEEAQRKANARLRRDNSKLRRALEHAEDTAEHLEQEALRSSASSTRSSPFVPFRERPFRTESEPERVGWGAVTFPEFPRGLDRNWRIDVKVPEAESEDSGEATQRPTPDNTPQPPAEDIMEDALPILEVEQPEDQEQEQEPQEPGTEAADDVEAPTNSELALLPAAVIDESPKDTKPEATAGSGARPHSERARPRPLLSSATFVSPGKSRVGTPRSLESAQSSQRSSNGSRLRRSPYPSPHLPSPHHQRTESTASNGTGPHRRGPSFGSFNGLQVPLSATKPATPDASASPERYSHLSQFAHLAHISPGAALAHRMDSVRSYVTEYGRTLGSELGSSYTPSQLLPTPARNNFTSDDYFEEGEVDLTVETIQGVPRRSRLFQSSSSGLSREMSCSPPTAAFVLRGSMSRSQGLTAYEQLYESDVKHMRPAPEAKPPTKWTPQPWASPSPSPHMVSLPMLASGSESDEPSQPERSPGSTVGSTAVAGPSAAASAAAVVSFVGATPLSRITGPHGRSPSPGHFLAPGGDPWDEYSDRTTPSPRSRALRPLLLGSSKTAAQRVHIHTTHRRAGRFATGNNVAHPAIMAHRRSASLATTALPRAPAGPVTIPGRIMHDVFCLILIVLDYIEWAIIIVYRLMIDIRAGPDAAITRRRTHAKRYYL